jgi:2-iminoacetate synthase ThiH
VGVEVSALVDKALETAGLSSVLEARQSGRVDAGVVDRLREADLLALGALADRVRQAEVGDEVRIYLDRPDDGVPAIVLPAEDRELTGLELLREVAVARIQAPRGANIRVDFARCGLELAQVAVGFGANELVGHVANKRGLPLADGEKLGVGKKSRWEDADVVKRNELAGFIRRAGRKPVFVGE